MGGFYKKVPEPSPMSNRDHAAKTDPPLDKESSSVKVVTPL